MSMNGRTIQRYEIHEVSGGVQNKTVPDITPQNMLYHCLNGEFWSKAGAVTGRLGSINVSQVVDAKIVRKMVIHTETTGAKAFYALSNDGAGSVSNIYTNSGTEYPDGTWSVSLASLSESKKGGLCSFAEKLVFCNGYDTPKWWTGTAWEEITGASVFGKYPVVYNSQLHLFSESGFLFSSDVINATGDGLTTNDWTSRGINPNDGQKATGAVRHRSRIYLFKTESIYIYNGTNDPEAPISIGMHSPDGYVVNKELFFHHPTGIYRIDSAEPVLISYRIQKYLDGMNSANWSEVAAGRDTDHVYFWIGDVTITDPYEFDCGTTYTDVVLAFNIASEAWSVFTGWNARTWCYDEHNGEAYFGDADGNIVKINNGYADTRGATVSPIRFEVVFKPEDFGYPELKHQIRRIDVLGHFSSAALVGTSYDTLEVKALENEGLATITDIPVSEETWIGVREQYLDFPPRVYGYVATDITLYDKAQ